MHLNNGMYRGPAPFSKPASTAQIPKIEKTAGNVNSFNVLRAVICVQIITGHFLPILHDPEGWTRYAYVGSESFFVIAGYFTAYGFRPDKPLRLSMRAFLSRRLLRLAVPYWISVAIAVASLFVVRMIVPNVAPAPPLARMWPNWLFLNGIVPDIAVYHYRGPTWFMSPLIQFIAIWTVVFWGVRRLWISACPEDFHRRAIVSMIAIAVAAFALSVGRVYLDGGYLPPLQTRWMLGHRAIFLLLGCFAFWRSDGILPSIFAVPLAAVAIVLGILLDYPQCLWAGVVSLIIPIAIHHPFVPDYRLTRILSRVGVFSYSIYLTHLYAGAIVGRLLFGPNRNLDAMSLELIAITLVIQVVAAVLLGAAFYYLVERPILKRSKKIAFREGPTSETTRIRPAS